MQLLFFDVETTGLPTSFHIDPIETNHWPYIVQIAWVITDYKSEKILKEREYIVKPNDWEIPKEATRIHKISQKHAEEVGVDIQDVLKEFLADLRETSVLVAHNIEFDSKVLEAEFYRNDLDVEEIEKPIHFCTMKTFTDYCEIKKPNSYDYKWPTLEQLHQKVMGTPMAKKHSALADVYAAKFCFYELRKRNYFELLTDEEQAEKNRMQQQQQFNNRQFINQPQKQSSGCWSILKILLYFLIGLVVFISILTAIIG